MRISRPALPRPTSAADPPARQSIRSRIVIGVTVLAAVAVAFIAANATLQVNTASRSGDRAAAALRLQAAFGELATGVHRERTVAIRQLAFPGLEIGDAVAQIRTQRDQLVGRMTADASVDVAIEPLVSQVSAAVIQWETDPADDARFSRVEGALEALRTAVIAHGESAAADLRRHAVNNLLLSVPIGLALVGAVILAARWLLWVTVRPLRALAATTQAQLRGEPVEFRALGNDEIGEAMRLLEQFRVQAQLRYDEARAEAARGAILAQLGDLISFATSEEEVVDATVRTLQRLLPDSRGDLLLANNSRDRLIRVGAWGGEPPAIDVPVPVEAIEQCPAIRRAALYVVQDAADNLSFACPAHRVERGALACIPLLALGQPVGVIHLAADRPPTPDVLGLASRIAEQVAVAIANTRLMRTMESLAMTDGLTGLRNARFFDAHLEQALLESRRDGRPVSVILMDVDAFKQFNDTHGHPAGDEALRGVAGTLRRAIRSSDVAARYGGEEFIVALHGTDLAGAAVVAEKLREEVAGHVVDIGPGRFGRLTASFGVASNGDGHADLKALVGAADAALYRAKASGRNRVCLAERDDGLVPAESSGAHPDPGRSAAPTHIAARRRGRAVAGSSHR